MKKKHRHCRAVVATLPDGTKKEWTAIMDAAADLGCQPARISAACRTGKPYRGTLWMYAEEAQQIR